MATKRIKDLATGTPAAGDYLAVDPVNGSTYKVPVDYFTPARNESIDINNTDWNTLTTPGIYTVGIFGGSGGANWPPAIYPWGLLLVLKSAGHAPGLTQIYIPHIDADPGIYIRQSWEGKDNWSRWREIGAVVGSNSNGSYIRFANGTQICWASHDPTSFGSMLTGTDPNYKYRNKVWVYPAAFVATPAVIAGGDVAGQRMDATMAYGVSATACTLEAGQYNTTAVNVSEFYTLAIGRWK